MREAFMPLFLSWAGFLTRRPGAWTLLTQCQNRKCTELPQAEFKNLAVKSTLYALNTCGTGKRTLKV